MSVPKQVALSSLLIPNKDDLARFRVELSPLVCKNVHITFAPEDAQVRDVWNLTRIPNLIRSAPAQLSGRGAIIDV